MSAVAILDRTSPAADPAQGTPGPWVLHPEGHGATLLSTERTIPCRDIDDLRRSLRRLDIRHAWVAAALPDHLARAARSAGVEMWPAQLPWLTTATPPPQASTPAEWATALAAATVDMPTPLRRIACDAGRLSDTWGRRTARGFAVDVGRLDRCLADIAAARQRVVAEVGVDLTRDSPATRGWLAEQRIEITDERGRPATSRRYWGSALRPAGSDTAWGIFERAREVSRTAGALSEIARCLGESPDGRLHPVIDVHGAATGRTTISGPALQATPRALRPLLRADPGKVLVACDLRQCEVRVAAALSGDPAMIEAVAGRDPYSELASALGVGRDAAKRAILAPLYGQGAAGLATTLGVSPAAGQEILAEMQRRWPVLAEWCASLIDDARAGRRLRTGAGRPLPRPVEDDGRPAPRKAVNWVVQGTAADIFRSMCRSAGRRLGAGAMWLPVHDELVVEVAAGDAEDAARELEAAMTVDLSDVSITGAATILGAHWAHV